MCPRQIPNESSEPSAAARGQVTRERLLQAAVPLIGEVGWTGVTTRLVAERAGVNQGLVHYHYASVQDLLIAASIGFVRELLRQTAEQLAEQPDVGTGIDWLLGELSGYTGTDPASLTVAEAFMAASRLPALAEELGAVVGDFRSLVADWLRERAAGTSGADAGDGGGDDVAAVATVLAAVFDGLVLHRALEPGLDVTALSGPLRRMAGVG